MHLHQKTCQAGLTEALTNSLHHGALDGGGREGEGVEGDGGGGGGRAESAKSRPIVSYDWVPLSIQNLNPTNMLAPRVLVIPGRRRLHGWRGQAQP